MGQAKSLQGGRELTGRGPPGRRAASEKRLQRATAAARLCARRGPPLTVIYVQVRHSQHPGGSSWRQRRARERAGGLRNRRGTCSRRSGGAGWRAAGASRAGPHCCSAAPHSNQQSMTKACLSSCWPLRAGATASGSMRTAACRGSGTSPADGGPVAGPGTGGGCDRRILSRGGNGDAPPSGLAAAAGLHHRRRQLSGERRPAAAAPPPRPSSSPLQRNWRSEGSCVTVCSSIASRLSLPRYCCVGKSWNLRRSIARLCYR